MKILYSTITENVTPYNRLDDEPVVGLSSEFLVLDIVELSTPEYDLNTEYLTEVWTVDLPSLEYRKSFVVNPIPEPPAALPNWNGLYQALLGSAAYQYLAGLALQHNAVDSALDKTIASISYGDRYPSSAVALVAFQSAVNLLLYALGLVSQTLSVEQVAEIRAALDENGFEAIILSIE